MITYEKYEEKGGLKYAKLIPNEGDSVRLKCIDGKIEDGSYGKQLTMNVVYRAADGPIKTYITCDAPQGSNNMAGSQIYRGLVDNNIQDGDVFQVVNGGIMNNKYKTIIYNIRKEIVSSAPQPDAPQSPVANVDEQIDVLVPEANKMPSTDPEEEVRIDDLPPF